jgi:exosome complex RNA-binding protein Rrp4
VEVTVESLSNPWEMAGSILSHVAQRGGVDVRVSGFNGYIWARILSTSGHADMLFQARQIQPEIYASEQSP